MGHHSALTDGNKCYWENQKGDMQKMAWDEEVANLDCVIKKGLPEEMASKVDR